MADEIQRLVEVIKKNKEKNAAASKIITSSPENIPTLSKLTRSKQTSYHPDKLDKNINVQGLEQIQNIQRFNKENYRNIVKLFPDIELAIQIIVSSILSPKKMTDYEILYGIDDEVNIPLSISAKLIDTIKTYIKKEYDLEDKLPGIIREALFETGSSIFAIIPEASVDEIINSDLISRLSQERFKQEIDKVYSRVNGSIGLISVESFNNNSDIDLIVQRKVKKSDSDAVKVKKAIEQLVDKVSLTDNVAIFKVGEITSSLTKSVVSRASRAGAVSLEDREKINYLDIFRERKGEVRPLETIKTKYETRRKSIGKPMVMKLDSINVIPVVTPGNVEEHVGYFVILDENGNALNSGGDDITSRNMPNIIGLDDESTSKSLIDKASNNLLFDTLKTSNINVGSLFKVYKEVIEHRLYKSIEHSIYRKNVKIADNNTVYEIMFRRALEDQKTNLLFIPSELVTYFAFYYNEIGIGESLLEDLTILASMRSMVMFGEIMGYLKKSIDVTRVNVSLDPNDPDPEKSLAIIQDTVMKLRQNYFPLGINNPIDLTDWIQRSGVYFQVEEHPMLPNVKLEFDNDTIDHTLPDNELEEKLRKRMIIALGLSPETVDNSFDPEFATTVVSNNILLAKRVTIYQKKLCATLKEHIRRLIINDTIITDKLYKIIDDNKDTLSKVFSVNIDYFDNNEEEYKEYLVERLLDSLTIELPAPENTNLENMSREFEAYKDALEKVIDSVISSEFISDDITGEMTDHVDTIRNNLLHYMIRKWMAENNYMVDLFDFVNDSPETDLRNIKEIATYIANIMKNSSLFIKVMQDFKEENNKHLKDVNGEGAEEAETESSNEESESTEEGGEEENPEEGGEEEDFNF